MLRSWTIDRDHNNWNNKACSFWLKLRAEGEIERVVFFYFVSRPGLLTRAALQRRHEIWWICKPHTTCIPSKSGQRSLPSFSWRIPAGFSKFPTEISDRDFQEALSISHKTPGPLDES